MKLYNNEVTPFNRYTISDLIKKIQEDSVRVPFGLTREQRRKWFINNKS